MQSLVSPFGYSSDSCGYCKDHSSGRRTPNSRACYYLSSSCMTVGVYQSLVDRGWRRSGTVFYKPDVLRHCCPHYTIRLPAASFAPAREHRQAVNRWNKHVLGEQYIREAAKRYPKSKEDKARERNGFDLISAVHESEYAYLKTPPEPASKFEVTLEPDTFTEEKYLLFKHYQEQVHHDEPEQTTKSGFDHFLCGSPLQRTSRTVDGKEQKLGSYHHCYRLDGRLIAMAVLDLLPHCVSGVYFIYHTDFEKWSFGKLSAMREAALTLEGGYQYYYMGFYIHSCKKMRYKGEYKPSYILDPETYDWDPLEGELRNLLDKKSYVSMSRERRLREQLPKSERPTDNENATDTESPPDDFSEFVHPAAAAADKAVRRGMSLFDLKVPGLMTVEEIEEKVILGEQRIKLWNLPMPVEAEDLSGWDTGDINNAKTLKGFIGELVACIGPDAATQVVINFRE